VRFYFLANRKNPHIHDNSQAEFFVNQFLKCIGFERPHSWGKKHNIDRGVIERITKGKISDPHNLIKVAKALNVSIDYLLTGEIEEGTEEIDSREKNKSYKQAIDLKEKEYVDKLLQIFRTKDEDVKKTVMHNIDIFLRIESIEKKKKRGKGRKKQ
jgi:transcriptional regulator with XRE-family HTH domain